MHPSFPPSWAGALPQPDRTKRSPTPPPPASHSRGEKEGEKRRGRANARPRALPFSALPPPARAEPEAVPRRPNPRFVPPRASAIHHSPGFPVRSGGVSEHAAPVAGGHVAELPLRSAAPPSSRIPCYYGYSPSVSSAPACTGSGKELLEGGPHTAA